MVIGLAAASAAVPAFAEPPRATVITPVNVAPDPNNIDLVTGLIRVDVPVLSTPAAPRLRFDTLQNAVPYLRAYLSAGAGNYVESSIAVHTGASSSASFKCIYDDVCTPRKRDGSDIGGAIAQGGPYYFTESSTAAIYQFDSLRYDSGNAQSTRQVQYYATSIAYPDGEIISFTYDKAYYSSGQGPLQHRLTRMTSSLGYYISLTYQGSNPDLPAWGTVAQATLFKASAPTVALDQLTYGSTGGGNTLTIADSLNRTFSCTGCQNSVGGTVELPAASVTLPGESATHLSTSSTTIPNYLGINSPNQVVTSVTRDGMTFNYAYTNLRAVSDGQTTNGAYTFDSVVVTGPASYNTSYSISYNGFGVNLMTGTTDALGRTTVFNTDSGLRPNKITYPEGNSVELSYDGYGNILSKVSHAKPGSGLSDLTETSAIDANACTNNLILCYRPTSYTDARGHTSTYAYDSVGRLTQRTDPADGAGVQRVTYLSYSATGSLSAPAEVRVCVLGSTCGTSAEFKTQYTYVGATALPLSETRIDGVAGTSLTTTYSYDDMGRLLSMDGPLPGSDDAVYYRYDARGRRTWEIGAAAPGGTRLASRTTYRDADDKPVLVEAGTVTSPSDATLVVHHKNATAYDVRRQASRTELRSAANDLYEVSEASSDALGRPECSAMRLNPAIWATPAAACSLTSTGTYGPDRITKNNYDAAGQLLRVQQAYGTALQEDYATYTYSANGKQASVRDANGNLAGLTYDGFDRLARWTFPSATTAGQVNAGDYEEYGYDANGNRTSLRKRDGRVLNYSYDNLNRVVTKVVPDGYGLLAAQTRDVYYGYDVRGLPTYARFDSASGEGVSNAYDGYERLTGTTTTMGGTARTLTYQYDAASNRSRITHPDGVYFTQDHDALGRAGQAYWWTAASGTIPFFAIAYDTQGRRATTYRASSSTGYGYDPVSRLTSVGQAFGGGTGNVTASYAIGPSGQVLSEARDNADYAYPGYVPVQRNYATNGLNQYASAGGTAFAYDANGNLTASGSTSYTYDVENRLVAASNGTSLSYDPLGRLYEHASAAYGTVRYLYDGDHPVAEYNAAGTMLRRYFWGPGADEPILQDEGGLMNCSGTRFLHTDRQGTIRAVADCFGSRSNVDSYDEYGIPGTGNWGRFQYTGQAWIPDLGMYYYKARFYSPTLGRFMQTDPVGYADQINLYAYVANDPVNGRDPTGEEQVDGEVTVTARPRLPAPIFSFPFPFPAPLPRDTLQSMTNQLRNAAATTARFAACAAFTIMCSTSSADPNAPADAKDPDGAKAPGKPGESEGFNDPKGGEKWGTAPNGKKGWVDDKGNVWVGTGPNGSPGAHGGKHWDVQRPGGGYTNVYPGGRIR